MESPGGSQSNQANGRNGRQPRGKLNPEQLSFNAAPPDYATVIIETERHSTLQNSDYGSISASQDLAGTPSIVSSELPLVESLQRNAGSISMNSNESIRLKAEDKAISKRDSIHSQSFR